MTDHHITQLETEAEWRAAFPVLRELRPDLTEERYLDHLREMRPEGYRLFALYEDGEILAVAGVTVSTNFYNGRHAFVYDLVVRSDVRSRGHGARLLAHVETWAAEQGCERIELTSGHRRSGAHRFYEREGYECPSVVFRKKL